MTKKERYEEQLKQLQSKQKSLLIKREYIKAFSLNEKIEGVKRKIAECDAWEVGRLCDMLSRAEIEELELYRKIIKISLAADFLNDCSIDYAETLKRAGLNDVTLSKMVQPIREQAQKLANLPAQKEYGELLDFMIEDDTLINGMHILTDRYFNENLNIKR